MVPGRALTLPALGNIERHCAIVSGDEKAFEFRAVDFNAQAGTGR